MGTQIHNREENGNWLISLGEGNEREERLVIIKSLVIIKIIVLLVRRAYQMRLKVSRMMDLVQRSSVCWVTSRFVVTEISN